MSSFFLYLSFYSYLVLPSSWFSYFLLFFMFFLGYFFPCSMYSNTFESPLASLSAAPSTSSKHISVGFLLDLMVSFPEIFSIFSIRVFADRSSDALISSSSNLQCLAITLTKVVFPHPGGPVKSIRFRGCSFYLYYSGFWKALVGVKIFGVFGLFSFGWGMWPDTIEFQD